MCCLIVTSKRNIYN
ncbi:UNVERIFIED_CONTAM: hypothetical protein GTU68_020218 [Idotea baltica]|nr:hypothetical protein [Idotea baltica]